MAKRISIKNIKDIVKAWRQGVYTPEYALKILLEELGI